MIVCANTPALKVLTGGKKEFATTNAGGVVSSMKPSVATEAMFHRSSDWSGQTLGPSSDTPMRLGTDKMTCEMVYNLEITSPLAVYGRPKIRRVDSVAAALEDVLDMC